MMKLPWRTILVPIIMVLHFIPFYYLVVKYDEPPQIQKEEIKNEKAEEESVEFEDEDIAETEELLEDEYTFSQKLAVLNEQINNKQKTKEMQQFSKTNADAHIQNHPAGLEKDHKTREKQQESYSANTPSSTSDKKEEQPAEQQTFKNSLHASYSNDSVATPEEYQKYYESYINTYTLDGKENGMPRLSLDVPDPVRHKEILHRMGFRLIIRPRFSPTCEPHAFHIAITGIGIEKRNTLPSGFALSALSSERNYYLKMIKNYPWYSEISNIPLEVVYYPEETGYKRYLMGKMTQVIRDTGLRQQDVLELLGVIKRTVSGKFILIVTEITVREEGSGYKKLRYFDKDESRFRFVS